MMLFHRKLVCFLLVLTALGARSAPESPPLPIVFIEKAKRVDLYDQLTYPARVTPKISSTINADSEGVVTKILAPLGTTVKKGQGLLTLKHTDPIYQYAPVMIVAYVGGVVSSMDVTEGARVTKDQKLATITDPKQVNIVVEVAVSDLPSISSGLLGDLKLPGRDATIPVKVAGISPFVDPATGTATCNLDPVQTSSKVHITPGVVGRVSFKARAHRGFQIADEAIIYRGKDSFLRVVKDGKVTLKRVNLGATRMGRVEILSGIDEGSDVVVRSNMYIADGEAVNVQKAETSKID